MKHLFGYIRVSTAKQGEQGVSLQEQRDAITRYAEQRQFTLAAWFEERETAAKQGRPVFARMLRALRKGQADGVVIHKIDRSARNLRDWADLGELIDRGIEVLFTNESLDLQSRGGRLSADIQAVVAADYIRNLREETRKGFYGRLKQGLYPLPAPLGYLDKGKGAPKEPDPVRAPLVKQAFELYATGKYPLDLLNDVLHRQGLRNRRGGRVTRTGLSVILNNPFYAGVIRVHATGETFPGVHVPLIGTTLFQRVQEVLQGKTVRRERTHDYLFRRLLTCRTCRRSLLASRHKSYVYYRCQTKTCPTTCVREEAVERAVLRVLAPLRLSPGELSHLLSKLSALRQRWDTERQQHVTAATLRQGQLEARLNRLIDAFVDKGLDKPSFEARKEAVLLERRQVEEQLTALQAGKAEILDQLREILERAETLYSCYKSGSAAEKRETLEIVTSNRIVCGKNVDIALHSPYAELAKRPKNQNSTPYRDRPRTFDRLVDAVAAQLHDHRPTSKRLPDAA